MDILEEEKPPRRAAKTNEGGSEGASRKLAPGGMRVYGLTYHRECLSDSEEKPPWRAAKANEGDSEEASRRLASSEKGKKSSREA